MTDRNMDYDYVSKQRLLANEHYQRHIVDFYPRVSLWTAENKSTVDGTEGIFFIARHANDTWEYAERDGIPILRVNWDYADLGQNDFRYLVPDFGPWDHRYTLRFSTRCYMDDSWYCQTSQAVGINTYQWLYWENEPGYRQVSVGSRWPASGTQVLDFNNVYSGQLATVAGWIDVLFEWNPTTDKWSGKMWNTGETEPNWQVTTEDGEEGYQFSGASPTQFIVGFGNFAGIANVEFAWMKLEYLP